MMKNKEKVFIIYLIFGIILCCRLSSHTLTHNLWIIIATKKEKKIN